MELTTLLSIILEQITEFMEAERSTLFLYEAERDELHAHIAQGTDSATRNQILRIRPGQGLAGAVLQSGTLLNIPNAYQDPRFNRAVDAHTGYRTRSVLCAPLNDSEGRRLGVLEVLNKRDGGVFDAHDEKLVQALAAQAAIAIENARLAHHLEQLRTTETQLNQALRQENQRLQGAYREIESVNENLAAALRKVQVTRLVSVLFIIGLFLAIGLYNGLGSPLLPSAGESAAAAQDRADLEFLRLEPQPVQTTLHLSGNLQPLELLHIVSPFTGTLQTKHVNYGEYVEKGQLLLELDPTVEDLRRRNAEAEFIRMQQRVQSLENWEQSSEVTSARLALGRARLEMESLRRRLKENKKLWDMGIIAREEYEATQRDELSQNLEYRAAEEAFRSILAKGGAEPLKIAYLELENARVELAEAQAKLGQAKVTAPVAGVVMPPAPEPGKDATTAEIHAGSSVEQGQILIAIGNLEGVAVKCRVDEVEIGNIRLGQPAVVTGEAFPGLSLSGAITGISSRADSQTGKVPFFNVTVEVRSLSQSQQQRLRVGMSADAEVVVYQKAAALLVPPGALHQHAGTWWAKLKDPGQGQVRPVQIKPGITTPEAVEVLHGLKAGDEILLDYQQDVKPGRLGGAN